MYLRFELVLQADVANDKAVHLGQQEQRLEAVADVDDFGLLEWQALGCLEEKSDWALAVLISPAPNNLLLQHQKTGHFR